MSTSSSTLPLSWKDYALLTGFCLLLLGYSLVGGRTLTMHEAVLPQSSREMLTNDEWIVPTSGGRPWLERPPLPQWITMTVASLIGRCDREWIVRIGPALMGTIVCLLVAWMSAGWFGRGMGLLSGLILATMFQFTRYSWLAEEDIFLCALVTAAIGLFVHLEFFGQGGKRRGKAEGGRRKGESIREFSSLAATRRGARLAEGERREADTEPRPSGSDFGWRSFLGTRSLAVLGFFVLLGMTNLAKGLLFGPAFVLIPLAGFLAWNSDLGRIFRYCWFWGILVATSIALAWPIAAISSCPGVTELWRFDLLGRLTGDYQEINQPFWYYLAAIPWEILPWTPAAFLALALTKSKAFAAKHSPERFLWCWALLPPLIFSFASGKHHHYLIQCLPPWAVFGALGLVWLRDRLSEWPDRLKSPVNNTLVLGLPGSVILLVLGPELSGPDWLPAILAIGWPMCVASLTWSIFHPNGWRAGSGVFLTLAIIYCLGYTYTGAHLDKGRHDVAFLRQVRTCDRGGRPLFVNADLEPLEIFRLLFYLDQGTQTLHNLTFLRDEGIDHEEVFVITRFGDREKLQTYGVAEEILRSQHTRREKSIADRLTLFRLCFDPDLDRRPADVRISPMQAMKRAPGPTL